MSFDFLETVSDSDGEDQAIALRPFPPLLEQSRLVASTSPWPKTTLMVRNIPGQCTQDLLLKQWPIAGTFDILYLPRTNGGSLCLGFAFVNFLTKAQARSFKEKWHGAFLALFPAERALDIRYADVQGFEANILQLKKKRVGRIRSEVAKPIIFKDGVRIDLGDI